MRRLIPHALFMLLVSGTVASAQTAEMLRVEGRSARLNGQLDHAMVTLQKATQLEPANSDIHVEMGIVLTGLRRYDEAAAHFRRALELTPNYTDARLGLARLDYFQDRFPEARAVAIQVAAEQPGSDARPLVEEIDKAIALKRAEEIVAAERAEEAQRVAAAAQAENERKQAAAEQEASRRKAAAAEAEQSRKMARAAPAPVPAAPAPAARKTRSAPTRIDLAAAYDITPPPSAPTPTRWRIDLDGSRSNLSGDLPKWTEAAGRVAYEVNPNTTVSGGLHVAERYDLEDAHVDVRLDRRLSPSATFYLQTGVTPAADFLPEWTAGAGGTLRVAKDSGLFAATVLTLDTRISDYTTGTTQTIAPGFEQYFLDGRIWLTMRWIHLIDADGGHHNGYLARGDVMVNDSLRLFVGYANAPETDLGLTFDTESIFGGLVYAVNDRTDFKISIAHEEREDLFDLNSISTGFTYRF
jgi:YaiO family outer membrane protein